MRRYRSDTTRRFLLLVIAGLPISAAWPMELGAILASTAVSPPARVRFEEERHNQLLAEPLLLEGYLEYLGPGRLRKVIETPFREAYLIESRQILVERNGNTRKISLKKSKALQTILGAIEAILSGETGKLESVFNVEVSGETTGWTVMLTPRSKRIAAHLTGLEVSGDDASVTTIVVNLKDGEHHVMHILHDAPLP